jgi:hypothetical protein
VPNRDVRPSSERQRPAPRRVSATGSQRGITVNRTQRKMLFWACASVAFLLHVGIGDWKPVDQYSSEPWTTLGYEYVPADVLLSVKCRKLALLLLGVVAPVGLAAVGAVVALGGDDSAQDSQAQKS